MTKLEKVTKGLECCTKPTVKYEERCEDCPYKTESDDLDCVEQTQKDALELLKDSGQDEGWLCEKRTSGSQPTDLLCACGNKVYFTTLLFKDGFTANELYCPNCGLSMRSPHHDKDGVWLRKHWEEVVLKEQEPVEAVEIIDDFYPIGDPLRTIGWKCGKCMERIAGYDNYCPNCGQAVKWE